MFTFENINEAFKIGWDKAINDQPLVYLPEFSEEEKEWEEAGFKSGKYLKDSGRLDVQ